MGNVILINPLSFPQVHLLKNINPEKTSSAKFPQPFHIIGPTCASSSDKKLLTNFPMVYETQVSDDFYLNHCTVTYFFNIVLSCMPRAPYMSLFYRLIF